METERLNPADIKIDETWQDDPVKRKKRGGWPRGKSRKPYYKKNPDPRGVPVKAEKTPRIRTPEQAVNGLILEAMAKTLRKMEQAPVVEFPTLMGQMRAILMMGGYRD